ncbi:hypothetical protein HJC23_008984 [Cyclotella cryptica]|uniref:Tyrosine specific protein phosphatases domain-containing protein n=1 Tax=Cyclotella cryptica TaxID=29204 RepID=A0ABD3QY52_9STRA
MPGDQNSTTPNRQKRKIAYRARHRLLSIERDATYLAGQKRRVSPTLVSNESWPWIPNQQCGSWYVPPTSYTTSVYFKSTDGHVGTYACSLKRLNLHLIELLHQFGGCHLVDSSVRKKLPDSFSRTIPIWCCVMNRIVERYRAEIYGITADGDVTDHRDKWDTKLYTPSSIVTTEEHSLISKLIDSRVQLLYESKAIVDPRRLIRMMEKPLRAQWVVDGKLEDDTPMTDECFSDRCNVDFYTIVCCNPSVYAHTKHVQWMSMDSLEDADQGYYYTPGAADDDATWGRGLTHELFWSQKERLLDPTLSDDVVDALIDALVKNKLHQEDSSFDSEHSKFCIDKIGNLNLWVGSRKAGRPPECWENFDAILNVTEIEYPVMMDSLANQKSSSTRQCFYLQLPIAEGKKDKTELERWMPVGLCFLIQHLKHDRRILVHCAQGRDRSVAVVLALVALVCPLEYPLTLRQDFNEIDVDRLQNLAMVECCEKGNEHKFYLLSGLPFYVVGALLKESGRDIFLKWMHQYSTSQSPLATKESFRIGNIAELLICNLSFSNVLLFLIAMTSFL